MLARPETVCALDVDLEPVPPLRERIGGRWLISLVGYAIGAVGLLFALLVREPTATASGSGFVRWVVAWAVACTGSAVLLAVLDRCPPFAHRRERSVGVWPFVVLTVGAAVVLGFLLHVVAVGLGLAPAQGLAVRILGLVVVGGWASLAIIVGLDRLARDLRNERRLVEREVAGGFATLQQAILIDDLREEVLGEVETELDDARQRIDQRLTILAAATDLDALAGVSVELHELADASVRGLSARLREQAQASRPRVRRWSVLANIVRTEPFHVGVLVFLDIAGGFEAMIATFGVHAAVPMMTASALTVVVITGGANRLMRRWPQWHGRIFVTAVVALQLVTVPMVWWREALVPGSAPPRWVALQVTASLLLIAITSAVGSYWRARENLQADIARTLSTERAAALARGRMLADLAREASVVLHGSVQSRLVACAIRSEQAIAAGDLDELKAALVEASRALDGVVLRPVTDTTLAEEVGRKVALWGELCDITVRLDPRRADEPGFFAVAVGRVVEEALANAIRHGDATAVAIDIADDPDGGIRVVVDDNGSGVADDAQPGMGTAYLAQVCHGRWWLKAHAAGTRLTAVVGPA